MKKENIKILNLLGGESKARGITLIALVITIIVLLILAGVAINMALNGGGLFGKTQEAVNKHNQAVANEQDVFENYVNQIDQLLPIDWDKTLQNAAKHPEQQGSNTIGVGTDGTPVNMDLWKHTKITGSTLGNDGTYELNVLYDENGYIGGFTANGEIFGTIPQYIKADGDMEFIEVTSMPSTFRNCIDLKIAPKIPDTVIDMWNCFIDCTNLLDAPIIPSQVVSLSSTFARCSSMKIPPVLPKSVINLRNTFSGCTALQFAPTIPPNVIDMQYTFFGCISLEVAPEISASVVNMLGTFSGCSNLMNGPSRIPNSVTNMFQTFRNCYKLEGTMEINATIDETIVYSTFKGYEQAFNNACQEGNGLIITGTCLKLNEIRNNNPNITIEQ